MKIASLCADSRGVISASIFWRSSLVFDELRLKNVLVVRMSSSPVFSSATIVLSNVGHGPVVRDARRSP